MLGIYAGTEIGGLSKADSDSACVTFHRKYGIPVWVFSDTDNCFVYTASVLGG
jgi:hypothetical protein